MATNGEIDLTLQIKDNTQPLTVRVPATLTPNEIIQDLQAQNQIPRPANATVTMTHNKTNLQPDIPLSRQGVADKDALGVVWNGELAGKAR
ncbi:MAG TPA: hypothetical protein VFQ61_28935 [Polyangiaceae bacterium]|nr:hypothetical protein [Polyangiaceae bacterium]